MLRYVIGDQTGRYQASTQEGPVNIFPTHKFKMPVNKAFAVASGIAKPTDNIESEMLIDFNPNRQYMIKNELAIYAIISTTQFKRPICFTSTQELKDLGLDQYVRQTGMTYQLVPVKGASVDTDAAYKNIMTKFDFKNASKSNVYFDEENRRHLNSLRLNFAQIAQSLVAEGKKDSARQILRKLDTEISSKNIPYGMSSNRGNQHNYFSYLFMQAAYAADDKELAKRVGASVVKDLTQQLAYYKSLGTPMSEEQFMQNAENAYQNKPTEFNNKQGSFIQDILTCYQLISIIQNLEKGTPVTQP
jgi:hypothetical protein